MIKNTVKLVAAGLKTGFGVISQSGKKAGIRTIAIFLMIALLTPVFLFNPTWQTQAQTGINLPIQSPVPVSAPPEPFVLGSAQSTVSSSIVSSLSSVKEFFSPQQLPAGFENAKAVSVSERMISSLGTTFGSIFGIPDSSSKKSNESSDASNVFNSSNSSSNSATSTNMLFGQYSSGVDFDFDGDGKADIARWHTSNTEWKIKKSSNGNYQTETIGSSSSIIAPGDYDGDGLSDVALFNAGTWTIKKSSTNTTITVSFGASGDKPVVGDYDGDGISDPAVFRPSTNTWWILSSSTATYSSTSFGSAGDVVVQGKFDGDNKTDIALFRPSTGDWHVQGSTAGYYTFHWGAASDIPVPADYDGDGYSDFAVYRGSTGTWYVSKSSTNNASYQSQVWGNYGDQPTPADYDGDGKADYSIWRPTTGMWYTIKSNGNVYDYQTLGVSGDTAVSSAYLKQIGGYIYSYDFAKVRLSPKNSTGGTDLYSRNFSWGTGLVGLSGRAGLDAGFGISYNSLVWTKDATNNAIVFDADNSNVTPGFRFGFPTIEPVYYDSQTGKFAYLMVTPSGERVEFRQTAASNTYETGDSSYTQLKINGTGSPDDSADSLTITVTNTSGTNMLYEWKNGAYRCQKITDRNGNYISINHDTDGKLQTVTDTLGRVITVNYNGDGLPSSITQTWKDTNGSGSNTTHTYAVFTYTTKQIYTNFSGSPTVVGPGDGYSLKVLQKITFPTESNGAGPHTEFDYNTWGQVKQITNYAADNHQLNYVKVNLPADATNSQSDCPRFTETRSWVENFNLDQYNSPQEAVITNSITENASYSLPGSISGTATKIEVSMTNHPHGAVSKTFVGSSGWMESLPIATEDWANGTSSLERKRWTWANWTQDDTNLTYIQNPRVTESKVGDTTNIKKTETEYYPVSTNSPVALYGLVKEVRVFDSDQSTVLKKAVTEYNLDTAYVSRRIIGLPSKTELYGLETSGLNLMSKVTYNYDEGDFSDTSLAQNISSAIQHDNTNFSATLTTGRGNLTSTKRWNVEYPTTSGEAVSSSVKYNTAGSPVAQIDTLGRTVKINYADNFNDTTTSRNTYAYPTKLYDPLNNYSEVKYRFDIGANVWAKSPTPAGNSTGKEIARLYDSIGRLEKETLVNTGAYTRYEYPTNQINSKVYTTVIDTNNNGADANDEVFAESWTDGAGRVRKSRTEHPNSTGGWTGSLVEYDILGQVKRSTTPTEINSSYEPAGDDATRGWLWTSQEYDWKGRVTRSIPTDSNGTDGKDQLISYDGCGCAGGQVTTIQGELVPRDDQSNTNARRTQKIYEDILGRTYKTEVLNWDGASVYTTTVQTFNGRDQITKTRQYSGTTSSSTYQDVTMTYDGHGRMKTRRFPIEDSQTETTWIYNADDSIQQIIDPRNAITNFAYNSHGLVEQVSYDPPANQTLIPDTPTVNFTYDALGNRTQMTDGTGTQTYAYNELSQLTSETKDFSDLANNLTISYTYNLGGGLKSITDPFSSTVNYTNDKTGKVTAVSGTAWAQNTTGDYADNIKYRAFGQIKQIDYTMPNDTPQIKLEYDNRLRVNHSEVTSSNITGGYLMKADYSYFADSRVQAKDDLLDNKWDRTMKYDFAGRLTFNQFGMGTGSNNQSKRVYEQTVQYDGFSQMTSRSGEHWDNAVGYSASYQSGRLQESGLTFDASGNVVHKGDSADPHSYQDTTYDAAGRRTVYFDSIKGRFGNVTNMIQETKNEYVFDGDGRPVIEKRGTQAFHVNDETPPPLTAAPQTYQVWSSVLGSSLTTVTASGNKLETKVFAGGALIAKQKRFVASNQNYDSIEWTTADPVTGTTGIFSYNAESNGATTEEVEPLGQKVYLNDPAEVPEPTYDNRLGNADFPEWQCEAGEGFYGGFSGMPWHCQKKALESFSRGLDDLYKFSKKEQNPHKVTPATDPPAGATGMPVPLTPTTKPQSETIGARFIQASHIPSDDGCTYDEHGNPSCAVTSEGYESNPTADNDAENGGDEEYIKGPLGKISTEVLPHLLDDKDCRFLMNELFGSQNSVMAGLYNPPTVLNSFGGKPFGEGFRNFEIQNDKGISTELATHIYGGIDGAQRNVSVYMPANRDGSAPKPLKGGYTGESQYRNGTTAYFPWGPGTEGKDGGPTTRYAFEYSNGLTVVISHVGGFDDNWKSGERNRQGSFRIGFIGGPGGDSYNGIYIHSHISFFRNKKRVDPRVEFCSGNYRLR